MFKNYDMSIAVYQQDYIDTKSRTMSREIVSRVITVLLISDASLDDSSGFKTRRKHRQTRVSSDPDIRFKTYHFDRYILQKYHHKSDVIARGRTKARGSL